MALQKREKKLLKILGIIAAISAVALYFVFKPKEIETIEGDEKKEKAKPKTQESTSGRSGGGGGGSPAGGGGSSSGGSSTPEAASVNVNDFESHNTIDDCWVLIDGKVYDITAYIKEVGDSREAASYCGSFGFEEGYLDGGSSLKEAIIEQSSLKGIIG